jgi:hypothetical protein
MQLGLRAILLVIAIVLFLVAAFTNGGNAFDFLVVGLACLAAALVVEELGVGGVGRTTRGSRGADV